MRLTDAAKWVGRDVVYYPRVYGPTQHGVITGTTSHQVIVQYTNGATAATNPERLEFADDLEPTTPQEATP